MRYSLLFLTVIVGLSSCKQKDAENQNAVVSEEIDAAAELAPVDTSIHYTYTTFPITPVENNADEGFGFEITSNQQGGMRIRQETIPAVHGNHPFLSEENAANTAMLMISKMEKGIMPPAVSVEELDSLGVVY
jgi:hypothetical protein